MKNKRLWVLFSILCAVCFVAHYRASNMDKILASKAERAFKNNEIAKAQEYMEQSFALGLKDSKLRDLYVNSIINSPLDVKAQEKLVKFLEYSTYDNAGQKAEYFLSDFKREIDKKYPNNYITQAVYNQKIMRWSNMPITYGFVNTAEVPEYFIEEIEEAFRSWEIATEHRILFTKTESDPNIIIEFNSYNPAEETSRKYVVAYTVPELNVNYLKHTKVKFYLKNPAGEYYSKNQVYSTALHEIVHAIGLMGHSDNRDDIMHYTKDSNTVINDARDQLTTADVNTVKLLYQIKPDITNSNNPTGVYIPYFVIGGEEVIQNAKMSEAVSYVRRAPNLAGGYIDLADSYVANKDYEKAEKSLKKALKLADSNELRGMIYYNLAVVYYYSENYINAQKYISAAFQFNNGDDLHYLRAEICSKSGDTVGAVKEYKNLITRNPGNIEYVIGLTNLYVREHKFMSARKVLKDYIKANPSERNNKRLQSYGIIKLFL